MNPWRTRLERWLAPAARKCPLSPNAVSVIALVLSACAAALLYTRHFLLAIILIAISGLADSFDGVVARAQGKGSRYGDFLDHFCDRVSDLLIMGGWLFGNGVRVEILTAVLVGVMLNGYIGTQIEATWHERNYDSVGRGEFVLALIVFPIVSHILDDNQWNETAAAGLRVAEWMSLLLVAFAILGIVQRFVLAAKLERAGRNSA